MVACDSDDYPYSKVPSVVLNEFQTRYPDAVDAAFNRLNDEFEVEFEVDGREYKALINTSGTILREKKEISYDDLPVKTRNGIQKEIESEKIEDLEQITAAGEVYYQAEISGFFADEEIVLDSTGRKDPNLNYWK